MADKLIDKAVELLRSTQDTPYKIAKATGLSQTIIGKWKKGEGKPSRANARYILQYFGISNIEDQPVSQGGEDVTPTKAELNNPKTMERLFELIKDQQRQTSELVADLREERLNRKEEVSRFLSLIEKMQGIAGAGTTAQKKEA
ncbi:helix-turn-helix domain-containing protein [Alistipes onderdonkii]|jgi:transcriptional regulator with XRE-family HTH domain|uniref:helix-turn-helix domain-containing protein n=1 Tax=Alistipes onderdonkii TaxID=328813 RepID=UPI00210F09A4|nr:helix-turn-helix transcriptional regulator [Alistipes onderdonkii]MCQ4881392.1 helix-turn-helix domain-containing protein [Alistipes onderdonkii]